MAVGTVAIVGGTGEEGFGLALRWARAGIDVVIGSRAQDRAEEAAGRVRSEVSDASVRGAENPVAVAAADVVVVTVPFSGQAGTYKAIAEHVRPEAVVIDCTVPVAASVGAKATHTLGVWEGSAAQQAKAFLPKGVAVSGAFHTLAAVALADLSSSLKGDVLVCGPKGCKPVVKELVEAIPDLRFVDAGPLENARIVEPITALLIGINHRYNTDRAGIRITGI